MSTTILSLYHPQYPFSVFPRARPRNLVEIRQFGFSKANLYLRDSFVVKFGMKPYFSDLESAGDLFRDLIDRADGVIYTVADAAVSTTQEKQSGDWLSGLTNYLESVLKVLKGGLSALHVPYSYGFAIILLTILVKAATFPLTKKQVESTMAMRTLQPQIKAIQKRYTGDQERIQLETARLYKLAGINPLAGCLPTLATIPVWIGLYRALSNVADEGLLTEGFFWIPTLSGPTTIAARQSGSGISWLFPFVDGHPPLGWHDTFAYLVLPILLIVSQYISIQIMQPSQVNDKNQQSSQALTQFLPLMIGYFALSVPSGLSLYWLTNNILSTAQQIWLQKLGGAKSPVIEFEDKIDDAFQPKIQNSIPEDISITVESKQDTKVIPGGIKPGDRFKQIKEEEARRRQEREEQKRLIKEAENMNVINSENKTNASIPEMKNGHNTGDMSEADQRVQDISQKGEEIGSYAINGKETSTETSSIDQKEQTKE